MYEVIFERANGTSEAIVTNDYATANNTFFFYANQKRMFGLANVYFINNECFDDSKIA